MHQSQSLVQRCAGCTTALGLVHLRIERLADLNTAETPFDFVTASYLTRIGNQSAGTLAELLTGLEHCSDASIFHHTFQTLGSHHFLTDGFSNDFAQWALSDTNRNDLRSEEHTSELQSHSDLVCRLL